MEANRLRGAHEAHKHDQAGRGCRDDGRDGRADDTHLREAEGAEDQAARERHLHDAVRHLQVGRELHVAGAAIDCADHAQQPDGQAAGEEDEGVCLGGFQHVARAAKLHQHPLACDQEHHEEQRRADGGQHQHVPDERVGPCAITRTESARDRRCNGSAEGAPCHAVHEHEGREDERDRRERLGAEAADEPDFSKADDRLQQESDRVRRREAHEQGCGRRREERARTIIHAAKHPRVGEGRECGRCIRR